MCANRRSSSTPICFDAGARRRHAPATAGRCASTAMRSQISNNSSSSSETHQHRRRPRSRRSMRAWRISMRRADVHAPGRLRDHHAPWAPAAISRPTMNFCRLPPDRLRAADCAPPHLTLKRSITLRANVAHRAALDQAALDHAACAGSRSAARSRRATARARRRVPAAPRARSARPSWRRCAGAEPARRLARACRSHRARGQRASRRTAPAAAPAGRCRRRRRCRRSRRRAPPG